MSQFTQELIKIGLDKGLLALILVGVAFYLNRAIEQYKARNAYYHLLSETKIAGYQKMSELLATEMLQVHRVIQLICGPQDTSKPIEQRAQELIAAQSECAKAYIPNSAEIIKNSMFFSPTFTDYLLAHQSLLSEFCTLTMNPDAESDRWAAMRAISKKLEESYSRVQHQLADEVKVNPFVSTESLTLRWKRTRQKAARRST